MTIGYVRLFIVIAVSGLLAMAGGAAMYWWGRLDERHRRATRPSAEPLHLPGAVRDRSRAPRERRYALHTNQPAYQPGQAVVYGRTRTPLEQVLAAVRQPLRTLPQRLEEQTTADIPSHAAVAAYLAAGRYGNMAVLPAAREGEVRS